MKIAIVGLNTKDYYVLAGQLETPNENCQVDFAGIVVQVGSAVTEFNVGDRVAAMAPSDFQSNANLVRTEHNQISVKPNYLTSWRAAIRNKVREDLGLKLVQLCRDAGLDAECLQ